MELSEIFKIVAANGVFAVLFLFMLVYELRDSRAREKKYQDTVQKLADRLAVVNDIKEEVQKLSEGGVPPKLRKESPPRKFKES